VLFRGRVRRAQPRCPRDRAPKSSRLSKRTSNLDGISIEQAETLDDVSAQEWDGLLDDDGFYCSHSWLLAHEGDPTAEARYLLARRSGELVAGLPLYRVEHELNESYDEVRRMFDIDGVTVVAGSRRGYRNVFAVASTLSSEDRLEAARLLVEAALGTASEWGATGVVWPFARTETAVTLGGVASTVAMLHTADAKLHTDGMDLQAYLSRLGSHRRSSLERDLKAFAAADWQTAEERLADCYGEAASLLANVERKYGHRVTVRGIERYLGQLAAALGDRDVVFTCRDADGALAAFAQMYRWRGVLYARMLGLDYARLRGAGEYFTLLFYEPITYAAERNIHRIDLGIESLDAKVLRGAKLYPLWSAMVVGGDARGPGLEVRRPDALHEWERRFANYGDAFAEGEWQIPAEAGVPSRS
jgi:uncharacterized protein